MVSNLQSIPWTGNKSQNGVFVTLAFLQHNSRISELTL